MTRPSVHHQAAQGFQRGSETYDRGRPEYSDAVLDWLRDKLCIVPSSVVLDLGAGTGKFTRRLTETGATVIAVEPVAAMLAVLMKAMPSIEAHQATAESIPLADGSVDAIVCAQAFHWFATPAALNEIARVLRPKGRLGLIWNVRDERIDWVAQLTNIITPYEGDTPRYYTGQWRRLFPHVHFRLTSEASFPYGHTGSPEQVIVDRTLSTSFIAALPREVRNQVANEVRTLIARTPTLQGKSEVTFPYVTTAFCYTRIA